MNKKEKVEETEREGWHDCKQGRIRGKTVADGWAGAVMQKPLAIQKCDGLSYGPTRKGVESHVHD